MENVNNKVGAALKQIREQLKWSQEDFAFTVGVDRTYVSQYERGTKGLTIKTLWKILDALNYSMSDFVQLVENQND